MKLEDFLLGFQTGSLKEVVRDIATSFLNIDEIAIEKWAVEEIENYFQTGKTHYPHLKRVGELIKSDKKRLAIHKLLAKGEHMQSEFSDWLLGVLENINNATIRAHLENQSKGRASALNDGSLRPAIILSALPEDEVRIVSLQNNIDITGTEESKFLGGLFSGGPNWVLVNSVAEQIAGPDKAQQGISPFCPDCAEDAPAGADHCISCGRELPLIICPSCDTENLPQAKFCMSCGEKR